MIMPGFTAKESLTKRDTRHQLAYRFSMKQEAVITQQCTWYELLECSPWLQPCFVSCAWASWNRGLLLNCMRGCLYAHFFFGNPEFCLNCFVEAQAGRLSK